MSLVLDLILIAIAVIIIVADTRLGFIRAFINMASTVVSVLLAYAFSPKVALLVQGAFMQSSVTSGIHSLLTSISTGSGGGWIKLSALADNETFQNLCVRYGANTDDVRKILAGGGEASEESISALSETIGSPVSSALSYVLSFIVIFVVSLIVIRLLGRLLNLVTKAPEIRATNRIMGFVLGAVTAVIVCWTLSLVFYYLMKGLGAFNSEWFGLQVIDQTYVVRFLSGFNPIDGVIQDLIGKTVAAVQ
ncbi:MAG: CvpA family protein [Clostridia bacterium]|nr:CvpA family protein [Clostridia bacterium]